MAAFANCLELWYQFEIFIKVNLSIFLVLVRSREKSQKYFSHSTFN